MGELRERRRLATPVVAAIGGMVVPTLIYLTFTAGSSDARGWGIVMGTDTAFALGVLGLVGRSFTPRICVFLLTLVIVDDIVALSVVALVYSGDVSMPALAVALVLFGVIFLMRQAGIVNGVSYLVVACGIWIALVEAGVHPTVAGVALGLLASRASPNPPRPGTLRRALATISRTALTGIRPHDGSEHSLCSVAERASRAPDRPMDEPPDRSSVRARERRNPTERERSHARRVLTGHDRNRRRPRRRQGCWHHRSHLAREPPVAGTVSSVRGLAIARRSSDARGHRVHGRAADRRFDVRGCSTRRSEGRNSRGLGSRHCAELARVPGDPAPSATPYGSAHSRSSTSPTRSIRDATTSGDRTMQS